MNKILFGGAFDPIHNGHINMALAAANQIGGEVIFIPSKISIWKSESIDPVSKKEMVELAIEDYKQFSISDFELNSSEDYCFSIDTVKYFKKKYPNDKIFYLIGGDQSNKFHLWKDAENLAQLAQILVFSRKDDKLNDENVKHFNMHVLSGNVSSAASANIRVLKDADAPEKVLNYIEKNSLYYIPGLKKWYKERYEHVMNVALLSYRIAKKHGLDASKAYIAGFLHDLGKMVNIFDGKDHYIFENKFLFEEYKEAFSYPKYAIHQFLGVFYAKKDYKIEDKEILDAILYHCTGKDNMSWLEKIVYAADKIEPSRGYDSSDLIKAMMDDLDKGFVAVLRANIDFINKKDAKGAENKLTERCIKYYLE